MSNLIWVIVAIVAIVVIALVILVLTRNRGERLRQLPEADRARYADSWKAIEATFVDDPRRAVSEADRLAISIYRQRGGRSESVPGEIRDARALNSPDAGDSTEGLRRSMQQYREAIERLLGTSVRGTRGRKEVA